MVFRDEIEPVLHSELRVAPGPVRLSMPRLFDTVEAEPPEASIARAEIPQSADQAVLFQLKRPAVKQPTLTAIAPYHGSLDRHRGLSTWAEEKSEEKRGVPEVQRTAR